MATDVVMDNRGRPDLYGEHRSNTLLAREVRSRLGEDHVLQPGTLYDFSFGQNPNPVDASQRYETTTGQTYSVGSRILFGGGNHKLT